MLSGYELLEELGGGRDFLLCRARRAKDGTSLLLKLPRRRDPVLHRYLARECELSRTLLGEGFLAAGDLISTAGEVGVAFADLAVEALDRTLKGPRLGVRQALRIAAQISERLSTLHARGFIHLNLQPGNVLLAKGGSETLIGGLGLATSAPREVHGRLHPWLWQLDLAYLSPEQTGYVARVVDYRADTYALGAVLYEMLTGRPPFVTGDAAELLHAHAASGPPPPQELVPEIPEVVSQLVMKLLSKQAEDRYQSGRGLRSDLVACLESLEGAGEGSPRLVLGRGDVPARFELSQSLYGRDRELKLLGGALEAQTGRARLLRVEGHAGTGKTALVKELRARALVRDLRFISGQYDELERGTPYLGLQEAMGDLARQLLTLDPEQLSIFRAEIQESLGANLGLLTRGVPELGLIVGPTPPLPTLAPQELKQCLYQSVQQFLSLFGSAAKPLVLFLDNLQWADPASLEFLEEALVRGTSHLVALCAYRDAEVGPGHPLAELFSSLQRNGVPTDVVHLRALNAEDIGRLVADTLRCEPGTADELGEIVFRKSFGNPYFAKGLLATFHEKGLLHFDPETGWVWDADRIAAEEVPSSLRELARERIARLSAGARRVVSRASALGRRFDLSLLAVVSNESEKEIEAQLLHACRERVLMRLDESYVFEHDLLVESAYELVPKDDLPHLHAMIARALRERMTDQDPGSAVFELAGHLNRAQSLLRGAAERQEAAELNLQAGLRAKQSGAFSQALTYLTNGLALLGSDRWEERYGLALALHSHAAEAAYLTTNAAQALTHVQEALRHARSPIDKLQAYETMILCEFSQGKTDRSVAATLDALRELGEEMPKHPGRDHVASAVAEAREAAVRMLGLPLAGRRAMADPEKLGAMRLFARAALATGYVDTALWNLVACKMVQLSDRLGYTPETPLALVIFGGVLFSLSDEYELAHRISLHGLELSMAPESAQWRPSCEYIYNITVNSWVAPAEARLAGFTKAHRVALECGDLVTANSAAAMLCSTHFWTGSDLALVERQTRLSYAEVTERGAHYLGRSLALLNQQVSSLLGGSGGSLPALPEPLIGDAHYQEWLRRLNPGVVLIDAIGRMLFHLVLRERGAAHSLALQALEQRLGSAAHVIPTHFVLCLCLLDAPEGLPEAVRERVAGAVTARLERLRARARIAPANHDHEVALVDAMLHRARGEAALALARFETAIEGARKSGVSYAEALAAELAAEHCAELGLPRIASVYLREASAAYAKWGAEAKVAQLREAYPEVLGASANLLPPGAAGSAGQPHEEKTADLVDVRSMERATAALAGELDLSRLVEKLMFLLLQAAGAQRGALLRVEGERIQLEAEASVDAQPVARRLNVPFDAATGFSAAVVRYVSRSLEPVVLADAGRDERFEHDPYVHDHKPRSVLCVPVLHQGRVAGIVYLENNRVREAFQRERLTAVQVISAQAAAALENARLHENLKAEVEVRKQAETELRRALAEVAALKDRVEAENVYLRQEIQSTHDFGEIVGNSRILRNALYKVEMVAATDSAVLILGETGTGKELVARAVHARSSRRNRPLVKVNCAALPATLIESELFGHQKGAFTGAVATKVGRFELADRGTIFLDEIGDLPLDLQAKLLRVLQEGEFERLGSTETRKVDVRLVAATNRDLEVAVAAGTFRADLFYRLSVFPIALPPLRDRKDDIPLLVGHFVDKKAGIRKQPIRKISQDTLDALCAYPWPGNVRELENVIERAMILSPGSTLELDESFHSPRAKTPQGPAAQGTLEDFERAHILGVLEECSWRIKGAGNTAERLGMHPSTLQSRMKKLGIKRR